uniref:C-type lectin domain-containing protein n=1 Tax=Nothobranchius furzeri TaxID=105023 RepID=A0A8C6PWJ5_NOTFU
QDQPSFVPQTSGFFPQRNYHFIYQAKNWTEAQSYCRENFIDLATVADVKDVATLNKLANLNQMFASSNAYVSPSISWFGLYRNNWMWSDDSTFSFTYWNTPNAEPSGGKQSCVAANFRSSGLWEDWMCDIKKIFICYSGK